MPRPQPTSSLAGSFRIFQVAGISVYMHWSWLVVAYIEFQIRTKSYESAVWNIIEYVALFALVLMHEFGHALACRQVGGQADEIVLWPLGGIAFVRPPARPGALLWSIAAGPLVNVALVPITFLVYKMAESAGLPEANPDAFHFLNSVLIINLVLLIINMLPIYPLDGGQIFQSLLWFVIGRSTSLLVVSIIGMVVGVGVVVLAAVNKYWWFVIMAVFVAFRSWTGFQQARLLAQIARLPRHADAACPSCQAHPFQGDFWSCDDCGRRFDTFSHEAECPGCGKQFPTTQCPECQRRHPISAWFDEVERPSS